MKLSIPFTIWISALVLIIALGAQAAFVVFTEGLTVTGMNNIVPWGLWITVDLSSIALSAGAFMVSATVYMFKIEKYKPVTRVAVFLGLIGYTMAVLSLLLDIGQPLRFWHTLAYWNTHSVLWEVSMCITLYTMVLGVEFLPIVGESENFKRLPMLHKLGGKLHDVMPFFAFMGAILSLLHQASLGAIYGVVSARPIWYKPNMPVMFITSAMAAGPALIILVSLITSTIMRRDVIKTQLLSDLGKISGFALIVYLFIKAWDIVAMSYQYLPLRSEALALLITGPNSPWFWGGEIILGGMIPAVILIFPRLRHSKTGLFTASLFITAGLVINRWNVTVSGLIIPPLSIIQIGRYAPTWAEWITTAGVLAFGALAYTIGIKIIPIYYTRDEA